MSKVFALRKRYWEKEEPEIHTFGKNVIKIFHKAGKIQIFPRVPTAPNGVGKGSTLDLESMAAEERQNLILVLQKAIFSYQKTSK